MANQPMTAWGKWQQTRNALALSLALNTEARNKSAPNSSDEKQLNKNIDKTIKDMQTHALIGLRMIDLAIADQGLVGRIADASAEARKEADRIKNATAKVSELTALVGKLTKLVGLFSQL